MKCSLHNAEQLRSIGEFLMHVANCNLATAGVGKSWAEEGRDKCYTTPRSSLIAYNQLVPAVKKAEEKYTSGVPTCIVRLKWNCR